MKPGLEECDNAVIVPHIASASQWTRSGMVCLLPGSPWLQLMCSEDLRLGADIMSIVPVTWPEDISWVEKWLPLVLPSIDCPFDIAEVIPDLKHPHLKILSCTP